MANKSQLSMTLDRFLRDLSTRYPFMNSLMKVVENLAGFNAYSRRSSPARLSEAENLSKLRDVVQTFFVDALMQTVVGTFRALADLKTDGCEALCQNVVNVPSGLVWGGYASYNTVNERVMPNQLDPNAMMEGKLVSFGFILLIFYRKT